MLRNGSLDEFAGMWMCADGDMFPTFEEARLHLEMTRFPETTGRVGQIRADLPDGADPWEGLEFEEVQLA